MYNPVLWPLLITRLRVRAGVMVRVRVRVRVRVMALRLELFSLLEKTNELPQFFLKYLRLELDFTSGFRDQDYGQGWC